MNYEGERLKRRLAAADQKEAIYRIDAPGQDGEGGRRALQAQRPVLLARLQEAYVADTGLSHYPNAKNIIWVYDVDGKKLKNPRSSPAWRWTARSGFADGIRCDEDGNVWAGMGWVGDGYDGVHVFAPDGARIGQIRMPEIFCNVCFGGSKRNRLFMTGSTSLYAVYVETRGANIGG